MLLFIARFVFNIFLNPFNTYLSRGHTDHFYVDFFWVFWRPKATGKPWKPNGWSTVDRYWNLELLHAKRIWCCWMLTQQNMRHWITFQTILPQENTFYRHALLWSKKWILIQLLTRLVKDSDVECKYWWYYIKTHQHSAGASVFNNFHLYHHYLLLPHLA